MQRGLLAAGALQQVRRQRVAGQRPRGHEDLALRQLRDLALHHRDVGMIPHRPGDIGRKSVPVHRQCAAGLHPGGVRRLQDEAPQPPQLLLEQSHSVFQPRAPQGVGADQLRELRRMVRGGHFPGLHLPERDLHAPLCQLPGRLAPREPRADYGYVHVGSSSLGEVLLP